MREAGTARRVEVLMLLVAAAAVVMRNDREASEVFDRGWVEGVASHWPPSARSVVGPALRLGSDLIAGLVVMTVGLGLIALRGPFVPAGRRWPGRGRAAIAAAGLAVGYGLIRLASAAMPDLISGSLGLSNPRFLHDSLREYCEMAPKGAILGAWSVLALAGRWESEADGLERLGRLLGWSWLASIALDFFRAAVW